MIHSNSKVNKNLQVHLDRLSFCEKIAQQSVCLSRHVGACLIKDGIVVSTGFNHVPKNTEDCQVCRRKISGKDLDTCKASHAEEMCILNYLRKYSLDDIKDCILYISVAPCYNCAKLIADCGIKIIYAKKDYNSNYTKSLFDEAGINLIIFDI